MNKYTRKELNKEQMCRNSAGTEEEICLERENDMKKYIRKYYLNEENKHCKQNKHGKRESV